MESRRLPAAVKEWRTAAARQEASARAEVARIERARTPSDRWQLPDLRERLYEAQQRQRSDVNPRTHHDQVERMAGLDHQIRRQLTASPAINGPSTSELRDQREQGRTELYDLRHPGTRSHGGPQPRLSLHGERQLHEDLRAIGPVGRAVTSLGLASRGQGDLQKIADKVRTRWRNKLEPGRVRPRLPWASLVRSIAAEVGNPGRA